MPNEGKAGFVLAGYHFNRDDITASLELAPRRVDRAGASRDFDKPALSIWELAVETSAGNVNIFQMTNELVEQLESREEQILALIERLNLVPKLRIALVLSADKAAPAPQIGLDTRVLRFLAKVGAFVDVETTVACPEEGGGV